METRSDLRLSTLADYVAALGGRLEVSAIFDDLGRKVLLSDRDREETKTAQLELPGLPAPEPTQAGRDVVFSIKPKYAELILSGSKTVELRRRFSSAVPVGAVAWIYSTTPTRAMTGSARIASVERLGLSELWREYRSAAAIDKDDFDAYFSGVDFGYAIHLSSPRPFKRPISLADLRDLCDFEPPQSYQYASAQLTTLIDGGRAEAIN